MLDFLTAPQSELDALDRKDTRSGFGQGPVSYTHLTLPTILLV